MPDPLEGLRNAYSIGPPKVGSRYVPTEGPQSSWDFAKDYIMGGGERPPTVVTQDPYGINAWERGAGNMPQMGGTTTPILGGLKRYQFWHDIPDLERIAGGGGPIRLYHGTTEDLGKRILREGVKLEPSGEAASQAMAKRYDLPWSQWKQAMPWSGYGDETRRLSTAPYPIASRWAQHFPQGEINSELNAKARIMTEANRRKIPFEDTYDQISEEAGKLGVHNQYQIPDAAGLPDRMKPKSPYGVVLGVDTDVRSLRHSTRKDAEYLLNYIAKEKMDPLTALKEWNNEYRDIKIAPQNVQNIEVVKRMLRK